MDKGDSWEPQTFQAIAKVIFRFAQTDKSFLLLKTSTQLFEHREVELVPT